MSGVGWTKAEVLLFQQCGACLSWMTLFLPQTPPLPFRKRKFLCPHSYTIQEVCPLSHIFPNSDTGQLRAVCPYSGRKSQNRHHSLPTTLFHTPTMARIAHKFPLKTSLYTNQIARHTHCLINPLPEAPKDKYKTHQSR